MPEAVILLAHGARSAAWAQPFEQLAAGLAAARPDRAVRLAFLEFMSPDLGSAIDELAAAGCRRIELIPCFFGGAGHVLRDVPPLLDAAQARHPGLQIHLQQALGTQPAMQQAMLQVCLGLLERGR